jgi:hypothetical protein
VPGHKVINYQAVPLCKTTGLFCRKTTVSRWIIRAR